MTDSKKTKVYDNIFDAFRHFAPSSILLTLDSEEFRPFKSSNAYQLIEMPDGTAVAVSNPIVHILYRGENDIYDHCEAGIFRNNRNGTEYDDIAIAIDEIRCIEFEKILMTFPQVRAATADGIRVDYMALAQHYELNTRMVDVSSEPEIAAYFATHRWNDGAMEPVYDGIGCIRGYSTFGFMDDILKKGESKLHIFGMQCFMRPGIQHAYGFETEKGEDLADVGWKVYFRQTKYASDSIHANFHLNENNGKIETRSWLFPDEEVADAASAVKKSVKLSVRSIREYCDKQKIAFDTMVSEMKNRGVSVSDKPIFELSDARMKELAEKCKEAPYGDVKIYSRLSCMQ